MLPRASWAFVAWAACLPAASDAAEVDAAFALGLKGAMQELAPAFERATGHQLRAVFEPPALVSRRIAAGGKLDVIALPNDAMEKLAQDGALGATPAGVAVGRMGIGVKPGSPRSDVSSPEALKRTLLSARAIVHSDPARGGAGAINSIAMFRDLGIAGEMKAKTVYPLEHSPAGVAREVTDGRADLALNQVHEIVESGLELLGPFPGPLARTVRFTVAPTAAGRDNEGARALVEFLRGPEGLRLFKAHGLASADP
jgi:molybdate transport system substrate-binding protein